MEGTTVSFARPNVPPTTTRVPPIPRAVDSMTIASPADHSSDMPPNATESTHVQAVSGRWKRRTRRSRIGASRGAAAVEFAMVIPILLLLTFGTLEVCGVLFLKEKLVIAAHEGGRIAIKKTNTDAEVRQVILDYLESRDIDVDALGADAIAISPQTERTEELDPITITVTVPVAGNSILPGTVYTWFGDRSVSTSVVMYKEFTHPDYQRELNGG